MTREELTDRIHALLDLYLNLEGGEMMLPLKQHKIAGLADVIEHLVTDAVQDDVQ
ncbi:hypothetical protein [Actinoplanes sp. URMC 104]|uniref:hypothetical protein n=1 Tax=Actinoplanes sp. URMC 104 TaxID=3423409 RepID=UPI003F1A4B77